jgi:hypothetical protein
MQENKISSTVPAENSTPVSSPEVPPLAAVVDATLGDRDVKIEFLVNLHGRSISLMKNCEFTSLICGGLAPENRGIFFNMIDRLIEDVERGIGARVDSAMPAQQAPSEPNDKGSDPDNWAALLPPQSPGQ